MAKKKKQKEEADIVEGKSEVTLSGNRYVVCIQDKNNKEMYQDDASGNSLKEMRELADATSKENNREVIVWDNFAWQLGDGNRIVHVAGLQPQDEKTKLKRL